MDVDPLPEPMDFAAWMEVFSTVVDGSSTRATTVRARDGSSSDVVAMRWTWRW